MPPNDVPIGTLFHPSSLPNKVRFLNSNDYQCNLCSKSNLIHHVYHNPNEELIAQCVLNPQHHMNHVYDEKVKKETLDSLLTGSQQETWQRILSNEWDRLAQ